MRAYECLLKYAVIRMPSNPSNISCTPSSACQFDLAKVLEAELSELGFTDVYTDELRYVYGRLPAAKGYEEKPCIGFIAHMDTVADFCDRDIRPCPKLGTGGHGFHGPYEHISAEGMDRCVAVKIQTFGFSKISKPK